MVSVVLMIKLTKSNLSSTNISRVGISSSICILLACFHFISRYSSNNTLSRSFTVAVSLQEEAVVAVVYAVVADVGGSSSSSSNIIVEALGVVLVLEVELRVVEM